VWETVDVFGVVAADGSAAAERCLVVVVVSIQVETLSSPWTQWMMMMMMMMS
jgi:hypothetical protein